MFRRLASSLPEDPTFPHDLKKLGYATNKDGFIKKIEFPDDDFQFHITNNERYNDVNREAMHACIRREVAARLTSLKLPPLYLPQLTATKPSKETQTLPILSTPLPLLLQKKRILILMNRQFEDLAILSYRLLSKSGGIDLGSAVSFVQETYLRAGGMESEHAPGIIIMNPGQLLYSHRFGKAVTPVSWDALGRKSAVHPCAKVHPVWNRVPGMGDVQGHLGFVFEKMLCCEEVVSKDAEIYLIGLEDGGDEMVKYLEANWQTLHPRLNIRALALTSPLRITPETSSIPLTNRPFLEFMASRAKAWDMSSRPADEFIADANALAEHRTRGSRGGTTGSAGLKGEDKNTTEGEEGTAPNLASTTSSATLFEGDESKEDLIYLSPTVSSNEELFPEYVFPKVYQSVLAWFGEVAMKK